MASVDFLGSLRCPHCARQLQDGYLEPVRDGWLACRESGCGRKYPTHKGIPIMLADEGEKWTGVEVEDLPDNVMPTRPNCPEPAWLARRAKELRITILQMVVRAGSGHIGGAYSVVDLLTALYYRIMKHDPRDPDWEARDRLVFSKGHCCLALYAVLADNGYFSPSRLKEFCVDGGLLGGHPERRRIPGVEATTGSLGHGLPLAVGMALARRMDGADYRVFAILGDGECNEGSVWEGFMSAPQLKLDGLTAIIDSNKLESLGPVSDILSIEPLGDRLRSFGWEVAEIDGHNMEEIVAALEAVPFKPGKPSAIVAHTLKGKGVSFMENAPMWHLRGPNQEEARVAYSELARALR